MAPKTGSVAGVGGADLEEKNVRRRGLEASAEQRSNQNSNITSYLLRRLVERLWLAQRALGCRVERRGVVRDRGRGNDAW